MKDEMMEYYDSVSSSFEEAYFADTIYCEELKSSMLKDLKMIENVLGRVKEGSLLDLGCGTGYWANFYCNSADIDVTGVDLSENMGELFRRSVSGANFIREDIFRFLESFDYKYDYILISFVLSHYDIEDAISILRSAKKRLNPGGHIFITDSSWSPEREQVSRKQFYKRSLSGSVKKLYRTKVELDKIVHDADIEADEAYFGAAFFNYVLR
ncbi:class I SAM-dependent DNA methyltransferase [Paraglaciecola sp.]|uniref:class I SAM-dependent DNA methyltransferase n=1 Tax=Paraglaciecola sp. TaxID=1920173 RepID=UPI003EF13F36